MNYLVIPDISEVFEACDPAQRKARLAKIAGSVKSTGEVKPSDVTNRAKRVASVIRKFHPDIKKEAVDPESRDKRIGKLQRTYRKLDKYGVTPGEKASALYRGSKDKRAKLRKIISQHRIPGKIKGSDTAKVTFNPSAAYGSIKKNRKTVQGTANWMTGYMHNPGATMHVARKKSSGKTKWYKVNKG